MIYLRHAKASSLMKYLIKTLSLTKVEESLVSPKVVRSYGVLVHFIHVTFIWAIRQRCTSWVEQLPTVETSPRAWIISHTAESNCLQKTLPRGRGEACLGTNIFVYNEWIFIASEPVKSGGRKNHSQELKYTHTVHIPSRSSFEDKLKIKCEHIKTWKQINIIFCLRNWVFCYIDTELLFPVIGMGRESANWRDFDQ